MQEHFLEQMLPYPAKQAFPKLREGNETRASAKKKEQREGVRRAKETPAINPSNFTERPQTCRAPERQLSLNQW